jgi:hypothetical protein
MLLQPKGFPHAKNRHYIVATSANGNLQYLYTDFPSLSSDNCFWGCLWFRTPSIPISVATRLVSFSQTNAANAPSLVLSLVSTATNSTQIVMGLAPYDSASGGTGAALYQVHNPTPIAVTVDRWHKIQFLFNAAAADVPANNLIVYDNIPQTVSLRTGAAVPTLYNMAHCRIMQSSIPSGFRLSTVWASCGANTVAEVQSYRFGETSPFWLDNEGAAATNKIPAVYMHGSDNVIQNSVNKQSFSVLGANFTSLVQATNQSDYVIL